VRKLLLLGTVAAAGALGLTAGALAGGGYGGGYGNDTTATTQSTSGSSSKSKSKSETYAFKATLTARQEVPKPAGVKAAARGAFTAKTTESSSGNSFRWKLTFRNLTGKAGAAHVHLGAKGKPGAVIIALCGPCRNGQTGTVKIPSKAEDAMEQGKAYVNVHTAKNAAGEIRGQIRLIAS
jgi:hypothetical protein